MNADNFSHLRHLMSSYLHQDWCAEFETPERAIDAFIASEPADIVHAAYREVLDALAAVETSSDPEQFLSETLTCYYWPAGDGLTVYQWLERVRLQLRRN